MAHSKKSGILVGEDKTLSYLTSPMVQVIVNTGEHAKTFCAHRDLVTSRSSFFANALKTNNSDGDSVWREGEEGIVNLPEDEPEVFAHYMQLIYHGVLPIMKTFEGDSENMSKEKLSKVNNRILKHEYDVLSKLYIFCEKIQDRKAKKSLIIAFIEKTSLKRENGKSYFPSGGPVKTVYEGTMQGDPLRKFFVDCHVLVAHEAWIVGRTPEGYDHQFLFDVMVAMTIRRPQPSNRADIECAEGYCKMLDAEDVGDVEEKRDDGTDTCAK